MHHSPLHAGAAAGFVLSVDHLRIQYDGLTAVHDVSFSIKSGEVFGLLGPNGAGKTSTLSAIEGFVRPSAGTITVAGNDIQAHPLEARASMGIHLQSTSFHAELTVREIVKLYAGLYGRKLAAEEIQSLLQEASLEAEAKKRFSKLSGGQQQRLCLAIATIHHPPLLLLDEPTTGLDPQSRRQLWGRIESLKQKGHSVLLTTHSMEEAQSVCDRIAIIDHGRIIALETPSGLIQKYASDPRVTSVARGAVTLEDVFIALTGREIRAA